MPNNLREKLAAELEALLAPAGAKAHSVFGASPSNRWLNCPGSVALSEKAPPQAESKYAREGTEAHAVLEFLLKNPIWRESAAAIARRRLDDEKVDYALAAIEYIEGRQAEMNDAHLLCETKVDASHFTVTGQFGTVDCALVEEFGRLVVIDYKYGAGHAVNLRDENGELNSQLVYYALGLSYQYHHNFSEVELVVIQPRAFHESGETTRSVVVSMDELLAWKQRFRDGVMETSDPNAPHVPGKWCKWCPAGAICPKLKGESLSRAQVAFRDEVGVEAVPEPRMIQLPHLGTILDGCERLEEWISHVRAHALGVLERGGTIAGWKLVDKRAVRKWADEAAAAEFFSAVPVAFTEPKLRSPSQVEAALVAIYPKSEAREYVAQHVVSVSSGKTMVKDSDERKAVVGRAQAAFTVVDI